MQNAFARNCIRTTSTQWVPAWNRLLANQIIQSFTSNDTIPILFKCYHFHYHIKCVIYMSPCIPIPCSKSMKISFSGRSKNETYIRTCKFYAFFVHILSIRKLQLKFKRHEIDSYYDWGWLVIVLFNYMYNFLSTIIK